MCALDSIINKLMIQTLRAQIEVSRRYLTNLAEQLIAAPSDNERTRLAALYAETLRHIDAMELQLASLEQQEREREEEETGGASIAGIEQHPESGTVPRPRSTRQDRSCVYKVCQSESNLLLPHLPLQ